MSGDLHTVLVERAAKWLQAKGCSVVVTDMTSVAFETPDAIGFKGSRSMLIECKASLSDFKADSRKPFRREPARGMGSVRYFCAPQGLIAVSALPPKWGLLEYRAGKLRETRKPEPQPRSQHAETMLLISAIRRIGAVAVAGVSVKFYTYETRNRATLGVGMKRPAPLAENGSQGRLAL